MKALRFAPWIASGFLMAGLWGGCDNGSNPASDRMPPASPAAVTSITGDGEITLQWYPNGEWDLAGYRVYRNNQAEGNYRRIAWVPAGVETYVDDNVLNGETYWYAVSAVDVDGNESALSRDEVFDTPRPAGFGVVMAAYSFDPSRCAYDFSAESITDYNDPEADIAYIEDPQTGGWMLALDVPGALTTEIQDAGFHASMDDISWAPVDGWSPRGEVELIPGHVYVVLTRDNHFAKFRVTDLTANDVTFDWAYQIAQNNRELRVSEPVVPVTPDSPVTGNAPVPPPRQVVAGSGRPHTGGSGTSRGPRG